MTNNNKNQLFYKNLNSQFFIFTLFWIKWEKLRKNLGKIKQLTKLCLIKLWILKRNLDPRKNGCTKTYYFLYTKF